MDYMNENNIESRTFFYPLHMQPCFQIWKDDPRYNPLHFSNSTQAYEHGVCLPSFPALSESQIHYVCDNIMEYFSK